MPLCSMFALLCFPRLWVNVDEFYLSTWPQQLTGWEVVVVVVFPFFLNDFSPIPQYICFANMYTFCAFKDCNLSCIMYLTSTAKWVKNTPNFYFAYGHYCRKKSIVEGRLSTLVCKAMSLLIWVQKWCWDFLFSVVALCFAFLFESGFVPWIQLPRLDYTCSIIPYICCNNTVQPTAIG